MNWFLWFFVSLISLSGKISLACLTGCKCSDVNDAAVCCLPSAGGSPFTGEFIRHTLHSELCSVDSRSSKPQWPHSVACLPSWRQLQVRLTTSSWPRTRTAEGSSSATCTDNLEKLVVSGSSANDDGLFELEPRILRDLFFRQPGVLKLQYLTVQQTQLREIRPGLIDQLNAINLLDIEIRRNLRLTCDGLGVGWLAGASNLRLLDMSRNKLATVNLAKWGFAGGNSSVLTTLDLHGNQIAYLKAKSFIRVPMLLKLDLSDNLLSSLPLSVFTGLSNLKILDLTGNRLTVLGLTVSHSSFISVFPELKQLSLSSNPLLTVNATPHSWWLSDICPRNLTQINLGRLTAAQQPAIAGTPMVLPSIAWNYCPSLTQIILDESSVPCISQQWLHLPSHSLSLPERLRISPRSIQLCPPSTDSDDYLLTKATEQHQPPVPTELVSPTPVLTESVLVVNHRGLSVEQADRISHMWEDRGNGLSNDPHNQIFRIFRFHGVGLSPWLLFALLFLLFLVVVSLIIWGGVYCTKHYRRRHRFLMKNFRSAPRFNTLTSEFPKCAVAASCSPDICFHPQTPLLPAKSTYSPLALSVNGEGVQYLCAAHRPMQTTPRLISPADSGMGDVTPIALQRSSRTGLSLSSSRTSVQAPRTVPRHHRVIAYEAMRHHVPSFASLHSERSPYRACHYVCASQVIPQKSFCAATSAENVSVGLGSTFDDSCDRSDIVTEEFQIR